MQPTAYMSAGTAVLTPTSTGHVPDPRRLLAIVMHVNDFDDDHLPVARIDGDNHMMLCLQTTTADAFDVRPPPEN
eukprot:6193800-Pleurochrysis_carterae.AAC.1